MKTNVPKPATAEPQIDMERALELAKAIVAEWDGESGVIARAAADDPPDVEVARSLIARMEPVTVQKYVRDHMSAQRTWRTSPADQAFHQGDCACGTALRPGMKFCWNCGAPIQWTK